MPSLPPKRPRHAAALALWLAFIGASMKLLACSGLDPNPPDPHETPDGDPPPDGGAADAAEDAP